MKEASKLLSRSDLRLREIAEAVGYTDVKYFMRVFKQHTGLTANEFRKRERATSPDQQPRYQDSQDRPSPDHPFRDDPSQDVWSRNRD
jgi:AraC-like DNA-binding protein